MQIFWCDKQLLPESARSVADKMLLEQYKVATLDYSYIVPNFPQDMVEWQPRSHGPLYYSSVRWSWKRECAWTSLPHVESTGRRFQWELSGQRLTKNWDYLLEIFYLIEQWNSQCVLKSLVVAKIITFKRVRASAYISLDVSFMVTLWNHGIPSRPRSCSLFFISICLKVGLINAWESFILGVDCVFIKGLSLTNPW